MSESPLDLEPLFAPRSIAVVGASRETRRMGGGFVLKFLRQHGFAGSVYPVNPKYDEVEGLRCYPSLEAIPRPIDLAVIVVPARAVEPVLAALPRGHVKFALMVSAGFAETGPEGEALQQRMLAVARSKGVRVVGPNAVGSINAWDGVVATISQYVDRERMEPGPIALVSQSGAFGTALLAQADREGLSFGYFVSSGNEADLEFSDFGRYLVELDQVQIVCGYLEGMREGTGFVEFARRAADLAKPVIALKVGSTEAGAAAAKSHTGALVGSDAVVQAVFDAFGVLRAADGEHLMDLLKIFSKTPPARGRRLAILSHSGGAGVMAADAAVACGADVSALSDALCDRLAAMLPPVATVGNPLDMTGGASLQARLMANCLRAMLEDDGYDAAVLCVNLIWRQGTELLNELDAIARTAGKPFAVSWVAPSEEAERAQVRARFPVFRDPARAARVMSERLLFDERRKSRAFGHAGDRIDRPARPERRMPPTTVAEQADLLSAYGIRLPKEVLAASVETAEEFRARVDGPVVVKVASPDIMHRTDIGGVVTNVRDSSQLADACETVLTNAGEQAPGARIDGVLVQEMIVDGTETIVGIKRDPVFGPMVVFGAGGMLVELIGDVELRPAPLTLSQAFDLIEKSSLHPLLAGYRGGPKLDVAALADTLMRVSLIAVDYPEIRELDLNPIKVLGDGEGCVAVDYKVVVSSG